MSDQGGTPPAPVVFGDLLPNQRKARFGVAYVRALCAQAGYRLTEVSADEDQAAYDCNVGFPGVEVRVQVKCTSSAFTVRKCTLGWTVTPHWRQAWSASHYPVYFVVVKLWDDDCEGWVRHHRESTRHTATAYWTRIDPTAVPDRVEVRRSSTFTIETFAEWLTDIEEN
ncbi:MAG: DUF4365 domain-containing protein [Acidimicrobiia bacterium]|nr:DUF4365 domain-containing protein [Acidimicrobiia bacterium]